MRCYCTMATVYVVNTVTSPLNVRTGPGTSYKVVSTKAKGSTVTGYDEKNGWVKISSSSEQWVRKSYLKKTETTTENTAAAAAGNGIEGTIVSDTTVLEGKTYTDGMSVRLDSINMQEEVKKTLRAFGAPPRFLPSTDPRYVSDIPAGRVYIDTIMSNPTILSLMPCSVRYLPKFSKEEKDTFLNKVLGASSGDQSLISKIQADVGNTGSLFTTKSAYNDYIKTVNMLCRMCAIYLGIGDKTAPGTSIPYKKYDWGFYTTTEPARDTGIKSVFDTITNVGETVFSNRAYIHFFCNQPGVDVSETISTTTRDSAIANLFNGSISDIAKDLNFLVGGGLSTEANLELDEIANSLGGDTTFSSLLKFGKEYLNGSRLVFPQMLDNVTYGKSMSITLRLAASSGDVESIYLDCIVPACHVLAFGLPRQVNENMYTYPFLCRANCKGRFSSELAVVTDVSIERGGDGSRWTIDSIPNEIDVQFNIVPLYSNLMVTSSDHPLLFLGNTALIEYLAVMCGVDMKMNTMDLKMEAIKTAIGNKVTDIPVNLGRSVIDNGIVNFARNFAQLP